MSENHKTLRKFFPIKKFRDIFEDHFTSLPVWVDEEKLLKSLYGNMLYEVDTYINHYRNTSNFDNFCKSTIDLSSVLALPLTSNHLDTGASYIPCCFGEEYFYYASKLVDKEYISEFKEYFYSITKTNDDEEEDIQPDEYYYGEIPKNITVENLLDIMVKGLLKFRKEIDPTGTPEKLIGMLDMWFEHDSMRENKFEHLVGQDDTENFFDKVETKLSEILENET